MSAPLVAPGARAIAPPTLADKVEAALLTLPQKPAPVRHIFAPGLYVREVTMPRTDAVAELVVGHCHHHEHLNIMLAGVLLLRGDDGWTRLEAPLTFVAPPGRKVAIVLETVVWQNPMANPDDCRDIDELEARMFDKSAAFIAVDALRREIDHELRQPDRDDFDAFLVEAGLSADFVRAASLFEGDLIEMPQGFGEKATVRASSIEGRGIFVSAPVVVDEVIGPARIGGRRTPAGRFTNHSHRPNARFEVDAVGDVWLVANRPISGCVGGDQGEEVTVDYRQALAVTLGGAR